MYYDPIYQNEQIYIAGPECFYTNGYPHWFALAGRAEMYGCGVTMPNNNDLLLGNTDKRKDADAIFLNCANSMRKSTVIILDLEFYRGPDVDGGSIYELGMAYGLGCRCYAFTRDLREMRFKYQGSQIRGQQVYDQKGRPLPYADLPFSPNMRGACKLVEGDFDDALHLMSLDITEERKRGQYPRKQVPIQSLPAQHARPAVYLAGPERWDADAAEQYAEMKRLCAHYGLDAVTPLDGTLPDEGTDRYAKAFQTFENNQHHIQQCDVVLANLNDFHGWEPDSDTAFECGLGYILGKKLYGYMDNNCKMIDRVPNFGEAREFRDQCGCNVENFDYPINCMFAGSMPILGGSFEQVLKEVVEDLKKQEVLK